MTHAEVTWIDKQRFIGVDSTGHSMVMTPASDVGVKPSDALLLALAGCASIDIVGILRKQRTRLDAMSVRVTGEQANTPPWAYQHIHLQIQAKGEGLRRTQVERVVDLALNKYCSVRASLSPAVEITFEVVVDGSTFNEEPLHEVYGAD
jgi:putative redox protein